MTTASKSLMSLCAADIMSRNIVMVPRAMSLQGAARMLSRAAVWGLISTHTLHMAVERISGNSCIQGKCAVEPSTKACDA